MTEPIPNPTRPRRGRRTAALLILLSAAGAVAAGFLALVSRDREARLARLEVNALRRLARAQPNDPLIFLVLGRRLRQIGERRAAFVFTNRAYDLNDRDPRFVAAMAGVLVDAGDPASAHALAENASTRWPDSGEVRAQLSRAYAARGRFTDALREAETAVRLAPRHPEAWQALGNARSSNKQPAAAYVAFETAIRQEPRDAELLADYGETLSKYGRAAEAERVLRQAVSVAPRAPRPLGLLGRLLSDRAHTVAERAAARSLLQRALQRAPGATDVAYPLALLELRDGNPREAIRHLTSCLSHDPSYGEAYLALGRAYQQSGEQPAARQAFVRWQRFSDYRRQLAHLQLRLRRSPDDADLRRQLEALRLRYAGQGRPIVGVPVE